LEPPAYEPKRTEPPDQEGDTGERNITRGWWSSAKSAAVSRALGFDGPVRHTLQSLTQDCERPRSLRLDLLEEEAAARVGATEILNEDTLL